MHCVLSCYQTSIIPPESAYIKFCSAFDGHYLESNTSYEKDMYITSYSSWNFHFEQFLSLFGSHGHLGVDGRIVSADIFVSIVTGAGWKIFSSPTQLPIQRVPEVSTPKRDAGHSPPSSARTKNAWSFTSIVAHVLVECVAEEHRHLYLFTEKRQSLTNHYARVMFILTISKLLSSSGGGDDPQTAPSILCTRKKKDYWKMCSAIFNTSLAFMFI